MSIHSEPGEQGIDPTFNDLHKQLASARIDYINHGGRQTYSLMREVSVDYTASLSDELSGLSAQDAADRAQLESTNRFDALGIDETLFSSNIKTKLFMGVLATVFILSLDNDTYISEGLGLVASSIGVGTLYAKLHGDLHVSKQAKNRKASAYCGHVQSGSYELTPMQHVVFENETLIAGLRRQKQKDNLEVITMAPFTAAGTLLLRKYF